MKKVVTLILCCVLCLTLLCACGRKTDANGNTLITSSWTCVGYTINGQHEDLTDDNIFIKLFMSKDNPKFECTDGENFTVTVLQHPHSGRIIMNEDGTFQLKPESGKGMLGKIEGNTLTIYTETKNMELVFETS